MSQSLPKSNPEMTFIPLPNSGRFTSHPGKTHGKNLLLFCQAPDSVAAVLRLWLLDAEDTSEGHVARVPVASTVVRKKVKCRVLLRALEDEGLHDMRRGAYGLWQWWWWWWWLGIRIQVDKCIFKGPTELFEGIMYQQSCAIR